MTDVQADPFLDTATEAETAHVVVCGVLGPITRAAFAECEIAPVRGETHLAAPLRDRASLYGVLDRLQDFGLTLVSVCVYSAHDSLAGSVEPARESCRWCGRGDRVNDSRTEPL